MNCLKGKTVNNLLLISGIVCLAIAIIGQSKLLFIEINPGFFGRLLALIVAIYCLSSTMSIGTFSIPTESLNSFLQEAIPRFQEMIDQVLNA